MHRPLIFFSLFAKEVAELEQQRGTLEDILSRCKGSLLEWLQTNKPGWEESIGKLVREDVLYNAGLHPKTVQDGSPMALYGVSLELGELDGHIRTPKELADEVEALGKRLEDCKSRRADAWNACQEAVDVLKKDYSAKIRTLREEKHAAEAENAMIPSQVGQMVMELARTVEAEKAWRESELAKAEKALVEIAAKKSAAQKEREAIVGERDKRIHDSFKLREKQKKELEEALSAESEKIESQTARRRQEHAAELEKLKERESAELSGKGADVKVIRELETGIGLLKDELSYIAAKRKFPLQAGHSGQSPPGNGGTARQDERRKRSTACQRKRRPG